MNRIPNLTALRADMAGYDSRYEIDTEHPLYNDPLVDLREEEFALFGARSYYSRPNSMTSEALPGIPDAPLARWNVAKRLARASHFLLTDPDVHETLGTRAGIRVDDALRSYTVQKFAFEVAWPRKIREENPELNDAEVEAEVLKYCARPIEDSTPTPHITGGAVDVVIMDLETGTSIKRGHKSGAVSGTAFPDFHEGYHLEEGQSDIENSADQVEVEPEDSSVVLSRRVLYYAMTNIAGLRVNPQEIWHYGRGDPLSEYVSGSHHPYYGIPDLPEWYQEEMSRAQNQ